VDGLATGGGILGRPVETVRCRTVDLEVPADAEIVVEGRITPGGPDPAIEVTAITHRREPLLVAGPTGPPASDDHVLEVLADESSLLERLRRAFPEVTAVCVPDWGGGARSAVVVALRQRYKGQARHLILTALGDPTHLRSVIVVDDDVDVFSTTQVNRAMTTRFQPAEDLIVLPRRAWGADATRP
jgi:UbiD family decarboxylase